MDFNSSNTADAWRGRLQAFVDAHMLPRNRAWHAPVVLRQIFRMETPPAWSIADSPHITREAGAA